jgi:hypothetical protein
MGHLTDDANFQRRCCEITENTKMKVEKNLRHTRQHSLSTKGLCCSNTLFSYFSVRTVFIIEWYLLWNCDVIVYGRRRILKSINCDAGLRIVVVSFLYRCWLIYYSYLPLFYLMDVYLLDGQTLYIDKWEMRVGWKMRWCWTSCPFFRSRDFIKTSQ